MGWERGRVEGVEDSAESAACAGASRLLPQNFMGTGSTLDVLFDHP